MADEGYQPFPDISAWTVVPFDPTTYEQYAALLEQARAEATEEAREHAVRTAIRYAGTDTGAIEGLYTTDRGFTRTVAISAAGWEAAANERGPNAAQIIKDQIAAYEWLLDLVTESRPITEHVVRELHALLCRSQETYTVYTDVGEQTRPLPKGEYKQFPNNPTSLATGQIHHYAPPDMVGPEVHRLVESLSSDEYREAHPVVQAAYLHYSLVAIHPFADGNGRTTRALASIPLYRALRVPLVVFRDQRDEYLDALAQADSRVLSQFIAFVNERVADAIELVRATAVTGRAADRQKSLAALRAAFLTNGFTDAELDALGMRVLTIIEEAVREDLTATDWPPGVRWEVGRTNTDERLVKGLPNSYRWPTPTPISIEVSVESAPPAAAGGVARFAVAVASEDNTDPVLVLSWFGRDVLPLTTRDVSGGLRETARIKIAAWANLRIDELIDFVAREALEARGRSL